VSDELKRQICVEREQLRRLLETHSGLLARCRTGEPTVDELAALAGQTACGAHGPCRVSRSLALSFVLPNAFFAALGLPSLAPVECSTRRSALYGPVCTVM